MVEQIDRPNHNTYQKDSQNRVKPTQIDSLVVRIVIADIAIVAAHRVTEIDQHTQNEQTHIDQIDRRNYRIARKSVSQRKNSEHHRQLHRTTGRKPVRAH